MRFRPWIIILEKFEINRGQILFENKARIMSITFKKMTCHFTDLIHALTYCSSLEEYIQLSVDAA